MRIIFFGTPAFAVPTLRALAEDNRYAVELVVTQPDRPAGRGRHAAASAVCQTARALGLPVYQPETLRTAVARQPLTAVAADFFVVAAYGLIFGSKTLAIPRLGCVNVHASVLPRYRGASPVAAAILTGDETTGVTLMRMERGLDTGPIIAVASESIHPADTTEHLTLRLGEIGAALTTASLAELASGDLVPKPQPRDGVSLTRPLTKADGQLDWRESAVALERRVRAMWPWPRAWTRLGDDLLQVHQATAVAGTVGMDPGRLLTDRGPLVVVCGEQALSLDVVQPAGGRPMSGTALVAGRRTLPEQLAPVAESPPPLVVELTADAADSTSLAAGDDHESIGG